MGTLRGFPGQLLHRFAVATALATYLLIVVGGLVRGTALAGATLERGHRLAATVVGKGYPQYSLYTALIVTPPTLGLYLLFAPTLGASGVALAAGATLDSTRPAVACSGGPVRPLKRA